MLIQEIDQSVFVVQYRVYVMDVGRQCVEDTIYYKKFIYAYILSVMRFDALLNNKL